MKLAGLFLFAATLSAILSSPVWAEAPTELLARVPLRFEPNLGQVHASEPVKWTARGPQAAYAFTADGALIRTHDRIVQLRMQGSNRNAAFQPIDAFAAPTSYFTAAYRGSIPGYQRLRRSAVYPGIDLVYYGKGTQLEYDFEVAPGADPAKIRLRFENATGRLNARLGDAGDLLLGTGEDALVQRAPVVYQLTASGARKPVRGAYRLAKDGTVSLALGKYDHAARLVIDPVIEYTQYFFGSAASPAVSVALDAQGIVYVAGNTQATDFYVQGNYAILGNMGGQDAWIMKINPFAPDGNIVPFTTLYGGSENEIVVGIAVDNNGIAYITGVTESTDMPTVNPYASALPGQENTFVAAFDTNQAIQTYGTYIGGSLVDYAAGIALLNGKIYITGTTTSYNGAATAYPTTANAIQGPMGGTKVFVSELDPTQGGTAQLVASTLLPGSADDAAHAITVDSAGNVYIAGETGSPDFRVTANGVQTVYDQSGDGFVVELNLKSMQLIYGTYLGGSNYDAITSVLVDPSGNIGVAGYTLSTDFPATQNAYQTSLAGYMAAFLAILNPSAQAGALPVYSTYFGGNFAEVAYSAARDKNGLYYITGYTLSSNLPVTTSAINPASAGGGVDGFIAQIDPTKGLNGLLYSSYITGPGSQLGSSVGVDTNGIVYVVGWATADIFPQVNLIPNTEIQDGFLFAFHP
jgi:hypothetical protein